MEGANRVSPQGRPATVLLVDDERVVADIYRLVLGRAGYDVLIAHTGQSALDVARSSVPDFIFLDMRMPGMTGLEVLSRLVEDTTTREIPVVMLSNYDDPRLVEQSRLLGAKDYVVKAGTDPAALVDLVSRWLNHDGHQTAR